MNKSRNSLSTAAYVRNRDKYFGSPTERTQYHLLSSFVKKKKIELVSGNSLGLNTNLPIHRANRKQRRMLNDTIGMESTDSRW